VVSVSGLQVFRRLTAGLKSGQFERKRNFYIVVSYERRLWLRASGLIVEET